MNLAQRPHSRRGFTLIEMLVVIAIITVLVALVVPAVMYFTRKGPQLTTTNEISQLDTAIQNFKTTYKVDYIPSRLRLCENYTDYNLTINPATGQPMDPLSVDSLNYLLRVWPQLTANGSPWGPPADRPANVPGFIDWNGNGVIDTYLILEGDQVLVFFLGGIPIQGTTPGCAGFSTDQRDPTRAVDITIAPKVVYGAQANGRKGPFYEFPSNRLMVRTTNPAANVPRRDNIPCFYYSYVDPYDKKSPYAYFSNYGTRNGYNKYGLPPNAGTSDCATLGIGLGAYYEVANRYQNPNSHQILSAGADGVFGQGGPWTPGAATTPAGRDDQCNFYGLMMGN